jgi:hypothetical protein
LLEEEVISGTYCFKTDRYKDFLIDPKQQQLLREMISSGKHILFKYS